MIKHCRCGCGSIFPMADLQKDRGGIAWLCPLCGAGRKPCNWEPFALAERMTLRGWFAPKTQHKEMDALAETEADDE